MTDLLQKLDIAGMTADEIKEYCVRCGICVGLYPELFAHNFDKDCIDVKYDELPAELEETAKNAARDCAVTAIYLKK